MKRFDRTWFSVGCVLVVMLLVAGTGPAFSQGSAAKESAPGKSEEATQEKGSETKGSEAKAESGDMLQMVKDKAAQLKTVKAVQKTSMSMMGQEMEMGGDIMFAAPNKFRMEMSMPGMPHGKTLVISNGENMFISVPQMNMVQSYDLKKVKEALGEDFDVPAGGMGPGQSGADFSNPFSQFKEGSVEFLTTEEFSGSECVVFEAKPDMPQQMSSEMSQFMPKSVKIWLGKADGMLRKQAFFTANGNKMMEMTYSDIEINPELEDGVFDFTPPADAEVNDMTEMIIKMSEGMRSGRGGKPSGREAHPEGSAPKSPTDDTDSEMEDRGI